MRSVLRIADALDRAVSRGTIAVAACLVPLLLLVAVLAMFGRNLAIALGPQAAALKAAQAGVFFALVMLSLGFGYLRDAHVRIDVLRRHQSAAARAWVDLAGTVFVLVPFCLLLIWFGSPFALDAFLIGESSEYTLDYPLVWLVKATLPLGSAALLLAGLANAARSVATLLRAPEGAVRDKPPA